MIAWQNKTVSQDQEVFCPTHFQFNLRIVSYTSAQNPINNKLDYIMTNKSLTRIQNFVMFATDQGKVNIDVFFADETLWLTQKLMSQLFNTSKQNISQHLQTIFEEEELQENSVVKKFLTTAVDGKSYQTRRLSKTVGCICWVVPPAAPLGAAVPFLNSNQQNLIFPTSSSPYLP